MRGSDQNSVQIRIIDALPARSSYLHQITVRHVSHNIENAGLSMARKPAVLVEYALCACLHDQACRWSLTEYAGFLGPVYGPGPLFLE